MGFVLSLNSTGIFRRHSALGLLSVLILMGLFSTAMAGDGPAQVQLLRSDDSGVSFEVGIEEYHLIESTGLEGFQQLNIPGFWPVTKPGEPSIPSRVYLVAIPPEVAFSVRYTVLGSLPLGTQRLEPVPFPETGGDPAEGLFMFERFRLDERIYSDYRQKPPAEGGKEQYLRHQRVVPVRVTPVRYDPGTGETSLITRIRVDISLNRSTGSRSSAGTGEETALAGESPAWERILSRAVINPGQARNWRLPSRPPGLKDQWSRIASQAALSGPLIKLKIRATGLHKLSAADAVAGGFPVAEPISNLHLFKRDYDRVGLAESITDIAFTVREDPGGTAGVFDGQDLIVFYAVGLREDAAREDPVLKFSDFNCVWLGTSGGPTMIIQPLRRGFVSADTATAAFNVTDWYEEDHWFIEPTPPDYPGMYPSSVQIDFYGYNDPKVASFTIPFSVRAMKPGTSLRIEAEILGGGFYVDNREVTLTISNAKGDTPLDNALVPDFDRVAYTSQPVAETAIADGPNNLIIGPGPPSRGTLEVYIMRAMVSYESLYRARNNTLQFDTGSLAGDTSITVTGLSDRELVLFDVTDPLTPRQYLVADSLFTAVGGGYAFSFRENLSAQRRYVLTTVDNITALGPADISQGSANTLIGNPLENGVDALVVCYPGYLDEMQSWLAYRRAQGYKVLMTDVNTIYEEFNNGVPHPRGIKNFIRHFYEKGDASFVLLVGDASEDSKNIHPDSPPNFVPTQSFPEYAGGSFNQNEVVTSDKWYVLMDNDFLPGQFDYLPDLIIGRLPAGSGLELQVMLNKIFMFEQPEASDFWRRRMVMIADDSWSFHGFTTCFNSVEQGFEAAQEEASQTVESSPAGGFEVVRLYLSDYTAAVLPNPPTCPGTGVVILHTRETATPVMLAELSESATLVCFQAHINRSLITHEGLFSSKVFYGTNAKDHRKIDNRGQPFIVFGFGCHFSDFALNREMSPVNQGTNDVSGDCIAELLMIQNNKGAVASYGSSGFEYLTPNRIFTGIIYDNFFSTPPRDTMVASNKAQARWILGELLTLSEIDFGSGGPIKRHHLLGDPMLRIDAGPPRFEVTVNGSAARSGDVVYGAAGSDTIRVVARISDEVAIEKLSLEIDGADKTGSMTVTPLVDQTLTAARQYEVRFEHKLIPKTYDIVLRASQAPDTTSGSYHLEAEFVLHVQSDVSLKVNGREVGDGDTVPPRADYLLEIGFPVVIDQSAIQVQIDQVPVPGLQFSHPTPQDTTTWLIAFRAELADGPHTLQALIDGTVVLEMHLLVSSDFGLKQVINYPNPFAEDTYFLYTNDIEISNGHIDIFTTSGKKITRLEIPREARLPGQNAVYWNGRDGANDAIANGVYLYIVTVEQQGKQSTITGKMARVR